MASACKPDPANNIYECSDPKLKGDYCLSQKTSENTKSNCPTGWESTEYCTEDTFSSTFRHKCIRKCANPLLDPRSGCTKCSNPLLDAPKCTACSDPLLVYPGCDTCCLNMLLDPKSECTVCSNPLLAAPSCTTCTNPLLEYPDCRGRAPTGYP